MIALIDYGVGNLRSVAKALEHIGAPVQIVQQPHDLAGAEGIILPGVGAFGDAAATFRQAG
ncbi:MAG: imidazole glycerol phosphate synthase subunit HisH, partial [Anaerolineae bacterium]